MSHPVGTLLAATYRTPAGPLVVVVDPHAAGDLGPAEYGAVVASTFRDLDDAVERIPVGYDVRPRSTVPFVRDVLARYADGDLDALDEVSVSQPGGPFQQRAWRAMRTIRAGRLGTRTRRSRAAPVARQRPSATQRSVQRFATTSPKPPESSGATSPRITSIRSETSGIGRSQGSGSW